MDKELIHAFPCPVLVTRHSSVAALLALSSIGTNLFCVHIAHAQTVYDAANDFSVTNGNPNGVWSYGYETTLGDTFMLDTQADIANPSIADWHGPISTINGNFPAVNHNSDKVNSVSSGTVIWRPNQITMHPGPQNQYSVLRWTAPSAGTYSVALGFTGQDTVGTTTDIHLLYNNFSLLNGNVSGFEQGGPSFKSVLTLAAGDTLDVAVGYGSNGNYNSDTTGVNFQVSAGAVVPEPSALLLALPGFTALAFLRRRR